MLLGSSNCFALLMLSDKGDWPDSWPSELEVCRKNAKSVDVAHGIQETVHEISFASRDEFEHLSHQHGRCQKLRGRAALYGKEIFC